MRVLHICSDFSNQSLYNQLITNLAKFIDQDVYVPVRREEELGRNQNLSLNNVNYKYSFILRFIDRINYFGKIRKIEKDICNHIDLQNCNLIHAHFLFSDGGVAYKLHKKFNIPYVVALRNTDLFVFFKYLVHLRFFAIKILLNAEKIIFISPKYKETCFSKYIPKKYTTPFLIKTRTIPNGVNPFWLDNLSFKSNISNGIINKFLYVGDFSKNKNIQFSIKVLNQLKNKIHNLEFIIVGGGGDYDFEIRKLASRFHWIKIVERTNNLEELKYFYNSSHVFLMPSVYETFGVSYLEAMSQGLPIIFSEGQGVDGFFENGEVGYAVKTSNTDDYYMKILLIIENYNKMSLSCSSLVKQFSWDHISKTYFNLYCEST